MRLPHFMLDIEPTNRCNAKCDFCPRDATPHQGLMSQELFDKTLERSIEFRDLAREQFEMDVRINFCGLGEPTLNRNTPRFIEAADRAGFHTSLSTNAALLDEARSRALLDAGLREVQINAGERDETYEAIYGLSFERTRDNIVRFAEMAREAGDTCQVNVVLVDHRHDPGHIYRMAQYWRERGIEHFLGFDLINRAGALDVDHMHFDEFPERAEAERMLADVDDEQIICSLPFTFLFVGYDGNYYLCCSDWTKKVPLGTVHERAFIDVTEEKLHHVTTGEPICRTCSLDPVNRLTSALRDDPVNHLGVSGGAGGDDPTAQERAQLIASLRDSSRWSREIIERVAPRADAGRGGRRLIPVQAL